MKYMLGRINKDLFYVFLFSFFVRLISLFYYQSSVFSACLGTDPSYYFSAGIEVYGGRILADHGLYVGGPLYPYFLGALMRLMGINLFGLRLIQIVIGSLSAAMTSYLAGRVFSRRAGIMAGAGYSLYGAAVFSELNFESEFLAVFFGLASAVALLRFGRHKRGALAGGVLMGLSALVRANHMLAAGLMALWFLKGQSGLRSALGRSLLFVFGFALALAPATVRNYMLYKEFVPISVQGGVVFYVGNNPAASYRYEKLVFGDTTVEGEFPAAWGEANRRAGRPLGPTEASSYWFKEGLRFIASEPRVFLRNAVYKVEAYFNDYEIQDNYDYNFIKGKIWPFRFQFLSFGMVFPLAVLGLFRARGKEPLLLFVFPLVSVLTVLAFYYNGRFRMTALPFFLVFASGGAAHVAELIKGRRLKALFLSLAAAGAVALFSFSPPRIEDDYYFPLLMIGRCTERTEPGKAVELYRKAISLHPKEQEARMALGELLLKKGDAQEARMEFESVSHYPPALVKLAEIEYQAGHYEEAIGYLETAVSKQPNLLSARNRLGIVYAEAGRFEDAQEAFSQALSIDPDYHEARLNLGIVKLMAGNFSGATASFEDAMRGVRSKELYLYAAEAAFKSGDLSKWRTFAEAARSMGATAGEIEDILGAGAQKQTGAPR